MTRISSKTHHRRSVLLGRTRGFRGNKHSSLLRIYERALKFAYRDRRVKKRQKRVEAVQRTNAFVRELGISYSRFVYLCTKESIALNRQTLAQLAVTEPQSFRALVHLLCNT